MPVDYQKGKIYKIVCNVTDEIYIGLTCQSTPARRLSGHVTDNTKKKKRIITYSTSSNSIIDRGNYSIYLIENFPCNNSDELHKREGDMIKQMQNDFDVVNKCIAGRTAKEWRNDNQDKIKHHREINAVKMKDFFKVYREENKESIKAKSKIYREKNIEKIKLRREADKNDMKIHKKKYYEDNRDKFLEKRKTYYEVNKEKIKTKSTAKYTCECGSIICKSHRSQHKQTKKHLKFIESQNELN
jgi:hypothetical protein